MKSLWLSFLAFLLVILLLPFSVHAQDSGWIITNYDSDISIEQTGKLAVTETIAVDFGNLEKHGIFRFIPYVYTDAQTGEKTYTEVSVISVLQDSKKAKYETYNEDDNTVIKIGDPDETISGIHMYKISYEVAGVLRGFSDHDELYWNVIGPYWEVPIEKASATVSLPKDILKQIDCFVGERGETGSCTSEQTSSHSAFFTSTRPLNSYEAFTIAVGYEKGTVPLLITEKPKTFFEKFISWPSLATFGSVVIFGVGTVVFLWHRFGRDFWNRQQFVTNPHYAVEVKPIGEHETIVVEYTPPEKLPPALLGVLIDEQAQTHDVTATIIDLARRGYLTIREIPKKWMFGKVDYELSSKKKDYKGLLSYESLLLSELFSSGDNVTVSSLEKTFYDSLAKVKSALYDEAVKRNLFPSNPESIRSKYLIAGIGVIALSFFLLIMSLDKLSLFFSDLFLGVAMSGIVLVGFSRFMPRRSAYGRELYRRVKGYELFIGNVEKYRQQFFEKKNMFNEVLPYAIVFGLTKKFSDAMDQMGVKPSQVASGWYVGTTDLNPVLFATHVNAFSSSFGSAISSTPSKSGGFSGGSSGGGFGGGGGGSW